MAPQEIKPWLVDSSNNGCIPRVAQRLSIPAIEKKPDVTLLIYETDNNDAEGIDKSDDCKLKIMAHKLILDMASDYFRAMFASNEDGKPRWTEGSNNEVKIHNPSADAVALAIQFIYKGVAATKGIEDSESQLLALLAASHMLQLDLLRDHCSAKLVKFVTHKNAVNLRELAKQYGAHELADKALAIMENNFASLMFCENISVKLLCKLINRWKLAPKSYSMRRIYTFAIDDWLLKKVDERPQYMARILSMLDLSKVNGEFLVTIVEQRDSHLWDEMGICATAVANAKNQALIAYHRQMHGCCPKCNCSNDRIRCQRCKVSFWDYNE